MHAENPGVNLRRGFSCAVSGSLIEAGVSTSAAREAAAQSVRVATSAKTRKIMERPPSSEE